MRTGLGLKFPANREIDGELRRIQPLVAIFKPSRQVNSKRCWQIPYVAKQGNLAEVTGDSY
jgi:hypothetical protein